MPNHRAFDAEEKKDEKKSNSSKWIALTIIILLALAITFAVLWAQEYTRDPNEGKEDVSIKICLKPECVTAASTLVKNMNRDVSPCHNFYEFACGNWNKSEPMPDDKSTWSVFGPLRRELLRNLRASLTVNLETLPVLSANQTAKQKIQKYFATCMDTDKIRNDGVGPLLDHLGSIDSSLRGWPFNNDSAVHDGLGHVKTALKNARIFANSMGIFNNFVTSNPKYPKNNMINFDAARFTLDRNNLVNGTKQKAREAYVEFGTKVALEFLKKSNSTANAATEQAIRTLFVKIVEFEQVLANKTLKPEDRRDETKLQHNHTLAQFADGFTKSYGLDAAYWVEYFQSSYRKAAAKISASTVINVREPDYYYELERQFLNRKDIPEGEEFLANYIGWKVIESYVNRLDEDFRAIYLIFQKEVQGIAADTPRWEQCVDAINGQLPNAVGSVYVQDHFRREAKDELNVMIDFLLESFKGIIRESYWMEEDIRTKALEKADKITRLIAYEDYLMDNNTKLNEEHDSFDSDSIFFKNFVNGRAFTVSVEDKKLFNGSTAHDWITGAAIANAFYEPNYNSISFPAGILQPPFLGYNYPNFINYAAIGTVIGHEITHGFDDQGAQSDGDGILVDWWITETNHTKRNFKERAQGIIDQYSNYEYLGFKLKGVNNQGENIADNGGLKESFRAYNAYIEEKLNGTAEPRLPGFETFTSEQMFYLSYAQVWCSDYRPKEMELQLERPHSPGRYRVIGPLHNNEDFARAYRCASDTYMNPVEKHAVW